MDCKSVRPLADEYLSDQLMVETMRTVVEHLARCPACRAEFDAQRRLRSVLRAAFEGAPELQPRQEFLDSLGGRLRTAVAPGRTGGARPWLAVAAAILAVVGLGATVVTWIARGHMATLAQMAAGDHQSCALKFALEERPTTLADAASKHDVAFAALDALQFPRALPAGALSVVERHACVYHGQLFAHIVLVYKDTAVSVLVADDSAAVGQWWLPDSAPALTSDAGFGVASFLGGRHAVFVVSALPLSDVQRVAQAIRRPIAEALSGG